MSTLETLPATYQCAQLKAAVNSAMLEKVEQMWNDLFVHCSTTDGKRIAKIEKLTLGLTRASLIYGEVSFASLGNVFWGPFIHLKPGGTFVDLGSGTGRGVFAAALLHNFDKCIGIEILQGLYQASIKILNKYNKEFQSTGDGRGDRKCPEVTFQRASFLDCDWSDADFVFANSTCFDDQLMKDIAKQGEKLKDGAYVVTLTKRLSSPYFKWINSTQYTMSWGYATVHIHQKTIPDQSLLLTTL